jgi:uncharacterized protein (TIGR03435 family)
MLPRAVAILAFGVSAICCAQPAGEARFEAASVRPAPPPGASAIEVGLQGGPGSSDPGRITYTNVSLQELIKVAYGIFGPAYDPAHKDDRISGPGWLDTTRFNIVATIRPGAGKDDFKSMLQNLLADRFRLALHREAREVSGYALVVAKGGPRFKESAEPATADQRGVRSNVVNGVLRTAARQVTMERWASLLGVMLGCPVIDQTGLKGAYDFRLESAPGYGTGGRGGMVVPKESFGAGENALPLIEAIQEQLGLRLEPKKTPAYTLVIDNAQKAPTEN